MDFLGRGKDFVGGLGAESGGIRVARGKKGRSAGRDDWKWGIFGCHCENLICRNSLKFLRVTQQKTPINGGQRG